MVEKKGDEGKEEGEGGGKEKRGRRGMRKMIFAKISRVLKQG